LAGGSLGAAAGEEVQQADQQGHDVRAKGHRPEDEITARKAGEVIAEEPSRTTVRVRAQNGMPDEVYEERGGEEACEQRRGGDNELANDTPQVAGQTLSLRYGRFQVHGLLYSGRA